MNPTRLQLMFRDAVGSRRSKEQPSWSTRDVSGKDPFQVMIGVGHLEASPGLVRSERMIDVVLGGNASAITVGVHDTPYDPGFEWAHESDLPGLATAMTTRKPAGLAGDDAFGSFYLRETRFPAGPDRVAYAVLGIAVVRRGALPERVLYGLEGEGLRLKQISMEKVPTAFETGAGIGQTFQLPIWGWGIPTRSIGSTLPLEVSDAIRRVRKLEALTEPTAEQKDELALLNLGPARSVLSCGRSDPEFRRFQALVREMDLVDVVSPADDYLDAGALARRSDALEKVVQRMLRMDEHAEEVPGLR